jgi:hypothetical protein
MKKFKYCDCLQVTAHHAAYPDNVSYFFEEKCYYKNGEELKVEIYSCGCEECLDVVELKLELGGVK